MVAGFRSGSGRGAFLRRNEVGHEIAEERLVGERGAWPAATGIRAMNVAPPRPTMLLSARSTRAPARAAARAGVHAGSASPDHEHVRLQDDHQFRFTSRSALSARR